MSCEDAVQTGQRFSLWSLDEGSTCPWLSTECTEKTIIRLDIHPGYSESSVWDIPSGSLLFVKVPIYR